VSPKQTVEEAIKFVRKNHCERAIESEVQVEYLRSFRPKETSTFLDTCAADKEHKGSYGLGGSLPAFGGFDIS
jgi:hypothetical protein